MILEACSLGQLTARAMRATGYAYGNVGYARTNEWAAIEWDVPLWFWRDFTRPGKSSQDFSLGTAKGEGSKDRTLSTIELHGLHFHRSGLPVLGLAENGTEGQTGEPSKRGRKAKYEWPAATLAIFGEIHRGDFKPEQQADVEKALQRHLAKGDDEPSESTVRPYAKLIWDQYQQA